MFNLGNVSRYENVKIVLLMMATLLRCEALVTLQFGGQLVGNHCSLWTAEDSRVNAANVSTGGELGDEK